MQDVSLIYNDHGKEIFACKDINLVVNEGEFLGILGPSGSGKSSLLYLLSGLKNPSKGEVIYQNKSLDRFNDEQRSKLRLSEFGFVFQHSFLVGYLTMLENILIADQKVENAEAAEKLLEHLGMSEIAHRLPHELSGGQRQRACVTRAILGQPKVIFADEPTAALDHKTGLDVMRLIHENRGNGSMVVVTHDQSMLENADRIITIEDGQIV